MSASSLRSPQLGPGRRRICPPTHVLPQQKQGRGYDQHLGCRSHGLRRRRTAASFAAIGTASLAARTGPFGKARELYHHQPWPGGPVRTSAAHAASIAAAARRGSSGACGGALVVRGVALRGGKIGGALAP